MKQSAAAFISLAPTDISWVDDRTTGFQHETTIKLVALLFLTWQTRIFQGTIKAIVK